MLDLYESYDSKYDREEAVLLEHAEIKMDKAILAVQTAHAMNELAMREAECRLVLECGDVMDLVDYYEDATEDGKEKEKGLLGKAWDAIVGLITKIKEALFGKNSQKADPNEDVSVDSSFLERHKKLADALAKVKNFFASPLKAVAALIAVGGAIALFVNVKKTGKFIKLKGNQVNSMTEESEKAVNEVETGLKGFISRFGKKNATDQDGEAQGKIGEFLKTIRSHIDEAYAAIKNKHMQRKADKTANKNANATAGVDYNQQVKDLQSQLQQLQIKKSNSKNAIESDNLAKQISALKTKISQAESARDMQNNVGSNQMGESAEDLPFGFDFSEGFDLDDDDEDLYAEDAGNIDEIAELLATL